MFADKYGAKYEKAVACLTKDREARLLRLPRRALGSSEDIESDRERVRDGAASNGAHEGSPVGEDRQAHGVQTGQRRCKNMATIEGRKSVAQSRPRRQIPKRHRGHQNAGSPRRLIDLVTQSPAYLTWWALNDLHHCGSQPHPPFQPLLGHRHDQTTQERPLSLSSSAALVSDSLFIRASLTAGLLSPSYLHAHHFSVKHLTDCVDKCARASPRP